MSDYEYNYDYNHNECAKCGLPNHHAIECMVGEVPIDYNVINVNSQESESAVSREDARTEGDLINLYEDAGSVSAKSSQTEYESDLKGLIVSPVKPDFCCELSPATPNYEARFQEDLDEAIRRSLQENEVYELNEQIYQSCRDKGKAKDPSFEPDQEQAWSDNEDFKDIVNKSVEKVEVWRACGPVGGSGGSGGSEAATSVSVEDKDYYERINDACQWETKATPKTLKNREFVPKSSFLAFESTASPAKSHERANSQSNKSTGPVTRTPNPDTNTVTVSSLRQKRRGRRDQRSYYDITPELQYLR